MDVEGRVALITGASSGIGRASALAIAEQGAAALILVDIDSAGLAATAAEVERSGAGALRAPIDVADYEKLADAFAEGEAEFGRLDIVLNNAGLVTGDPSWPDTEPARIRAVVSVNLLGVVFGTKLAIQYLGRRDGGVVINTASPAAFGPMPTDPLYSCTKEAIVNFTQACSRFAESHGVRVNAIMPGVTDTPILAKTGDGRSPAAWLQPLLDSIVPLEPSDVAAGMLNIVADDQRAGEALLIDNPAAPGEPPRLVRLRNPADFHEAAAARARRR